MKHVAEVRSAMDSTQDQDELLLLGSTGASQARVAGGSGEALGPGGSPSAGGQERLQQQQQQQRGRSGGSSGSRPSGKERRRLRRLQAEPRSVIGLGEGPSGVNVLDYLEAHATELNSMRKALSQKGKGKRVFQTLPRHMRRRAMSHNPKRLPRRLRQVAAKEMEGNGTPAKRRPPSRKQRRKPSVLREEKEEREHVWLETHLWHVKRMKMVSHYGFRLAEHCCDKGVRAAHRSLVHGCLLSDISYYRCNEVTGLQRAIVACLSPLFNMDTGLTIKAKACLGGQREGKAVMYKFGAYPHGALGPVQFLWQAPYPTVSVLTSSDIPASNGGEGGVGCPASKEHPTKLWIWCHPAAQDSILEELTTAIAAYNKASPKCVSPSINVVADLSQSPTPPTTISEGVTVLVRDLVRFRLIGPRSHALLMETLKPVWRDGHFPPEAPKAAGEARPGQEEEDEEMSESDGNMRNDSECGDEEDPLPPVLERWWEGEHGPRLAAHCQALASEYQAIRAASEPAQFPRGAVLGMCVQDPRLFTPSKKTDMVSAYYPPRKSKGLYNLPTVEEGEGEEEEDGRELDAEASDDDDLDGADAIVPDVLPCSSAGPPSAPTQAYPTITYLPPELSFSPIWDQEVCEAASKSRASDHYLNHKRSKRLLRSSSDLSLGSLAPQIPVLLIQQSPLSSSTTSSHHHHHRHTPLGAGWDLVMPSKWATPFLVSLEYRGARVCGTKELRKCSLESLGLHFPHDFPDTPAGAQHEAERRRELEMHYMRMPPDKKPNFGKLLVPTPFHCPWEDLVRFWSKAARSDGGCSDGDGGGGGGYSVGMKRLASLTVPSSKRIKLEDWEVTEVVTSESAPLADGGGGGGAVGGDGFVPNVFAALGADSLGFYVVRSREDLNSLRQFIESVLGRGKRPQVVRSCGGGEDFQSLLQRFAIDSLLEKHASGMVAVQLVVHNSAETIISCLDTIYLPQPSDLKSLLDHRASSLSLPGAPSFSGASPFSAAPSFSGPCEKINKLGLTVVTPAGNLVVGTSGHSKNNLKTIKKKRVNGGTVNMVKDFRMRPIKTSHQPVGYVTTAGCRLTTSLSSGLGFVTLPGLVELVKRGHAAASPTPLLLALARGVSTKYYFVTVNIL